VGLQLRAPAADLALWGGQDQGFLEILGAKFEFLFLLNVVVFFTKLPFFASNIGSVVCTNAEGKNDGMKSATFSYIISKIIENSNFI
jgi:hypothetical protein